MRPQEIYEKHVESCAETAGLTLATDKSCSNVGVWYFYDEEMTFVGEVSFNFQHGYSCFKAEGLYADGVSMGYVKPDELKVALTALADYIGARP